MKKREEYAELQNTYERLAKQQCNLDAEYRHLRNFCLGLKLEILRHANCEDPRINNYLQQAASSLRMVPQRSGVEMGQGLGPVVRGRGWMGMQMPSVQIPQAQLNNHKGDMTTLPMQQTMQVGQQMGGRRGMADGGG
ncbi:uncharacterized protein BDZ99DRAFT_212199 [Mytilinidion resinicola]|uniref:Uncharacterized protein n=1 Tax=Mytilinidion resinicola TaxID=574789 RepID=A0A6A6Y178_9PEZI|nr:uncharacterized protein BDZ99DRAFT_212199 [Mytilinidion resinicola]KAF2801985.1 hypothetical protein BDZ99DRAFT_212199 [Mytilinidion resinicola]